MVSDREASTDLRQAALDAFERQIPFPLAVLDPEFRFLWASASFEAVLGYRPEDLLGTVAFDLLNPEDVEQILPMASDFIGAADDMLREPTAAGGVELPTRVRHADGSWLPMAVSGRILDDTGRTMLCIRLAIDRFALDAVIGSVSNGFDIDTTATSLVGLARLQFRVGHAALLHDTDGTPTVVGSSGLVSEEDRRTLLQRTRVEGPSDEVRWDDERWIAPVLSPTKESLLGLFVLDSPRVGGPTPYDRFVLERLAGLASLAFARIETDRLLHRSATTDYLTGVVNRREFDARVLRLPLVPDAFPAALVYVDLDDFKLVNDQYGHGVGDVVLATIAERLTAALRPGDVVGRIGGDEFAVLCTRVSAAEVDDVECRVLAAASEPVQVGDHELLVRLSVGAAVAEDEAELEDLAARADAAMYARKYAGRPTPVDL